MVSTKRQIRKDGDRYGNFDSDYTESPFISEYGIVNTPEDTDYTSGSSYIMSEDIDIRGEAPAADTLYSTRDTVSAPATDVPERPKKEEEPHTREDVLPTLKTRVYAPEKFDEKKIAAEAPAKRERRGISSRERVMLCIYIAVALVLAIAVIATGITISSASAEADVLTEQIAQKQVVIAEQEATLATLRNDDNIRGRASSLGMVEADGAVYEAPTVPTGEYPEAEPHTNGFDKFMDWFTRVFG